MIQIPENIKKLGICNLLDLYIKYPPAKYTNGKLTESLEINSTIVVKIVIQSYNKIGKNAIINAIVLSIDGSEKINLFIFNAKPYHKNIFTLGKEMIVSGIGGIYNGRFTIKQPKVITQEDEIILHFNKKLVGKQITILRDFIKSITLDVLIQAYPNIESKILKRLHAIHNPTSDFLKSFTHNKEFDMQTKKALAFAEIYNYMLELKGKVLHFKSLEKLNNKKLLEKWINSLPFNLTNGQKDAIRDIEISLNSNLASRRIIVGDVGCGKTILIFAACILCYPRQCILMAPTSILAQQIYNEALKMLPQEINVGLCIKDKKDLDFSKYHFIIGTHKILYTNIDNNTLDMPLVMIDEQHRFGTKQRNILDKSLEKEGKKPHFLQFSATPIPRTMAMIESSLLSFTFINDLPFKKDITSKVITNNDFASLLEHIKLETKKGNQTIIIYPLVEKKSENNIYKPIKEAKEFWERHFKRVHLVHGKDKNKEQILEEFQQNGEILLSTTVVEVGISLPRLSTIVISGAENFGFATLHQLRGRVSRNGLKGFCFLYTKKQNIEKLAQFCEIQNGFEVAKLDLQRRKGGDMLSGVKQSGSEFNWYNFEEHITQKAKDSIDKLES
ncbi:ATP-dependent DNA helicase RecG [Helicobacter ibis]|uniref:ATP-dependent DNA helicase RecG n=1 Tax=Helicobacter ibis TaxID=2962633 RepID=A0ABT4VFM1_9HELI|nr:ATP-dependent DNA helicase RecG [Helicobacter ibis]MDA3969487.1 ATP-dependent DNA helicase RecG [Helicobacter ibis]